MPRYIGIIVILSSILGFPSSLKAQDFPQRTTPRSPAEEAKVKVDFLKTVKESLIKSCDKTASISNSFDKAVACECYANSYMDRYDPETLLKISTWAYQNSDKTSIIVLMLTPEKIKCKIP